MSAARIRRIAEAANALNPDAVLLLGDFNAGHFFVTRAVGAQQIGEALSVLRAPLGCYSVLGNHDWWHGPVLTSPFDGTVAIRRALASGGDRGARKRRGRAGQGRPEILDRRPCRPADRRHGADRLRRAKLGGDDLDGALAKVSDDAPVILLAHEPIIFTAVPDRVALTLCGHTHGGQINLPLLGPVVGDLRFGPNMSMAMSEQGGRHMIISGGLGESVAPVRLLRPPEIVEVELGAAEDETARLSGF